jgi:hypothetical protein
MFLLAWKNVRYLLIIESSTFNSRFHFLQFNWGLWKFLDYLLFLFQVIVLILFSHKTSKFQENKWWRFKKAPVYLVSPFGEASLFKLKHNQCAISIFSWRLWGSSRSVSVRFYLGSSGISELCHTDIWIIWARFRVVNFSRIRIIFWFDYPFLDNDSVNTFQRNVSLQQKDVHCYITD